MFVRQKISGLLIKDQDELYVMPVIVGGDGNTGPSCPINDDTPPLEP